MIEGRMAKGMITTWILFPAYWFSWRYFSQPSKIAKKIKLNKIDVKMIAKFTKP